MKPTHFASAAELRHWLEKNHASAGELAVGFHKKASGKPGLTYPEALDEALCFGWIDGIRKRIDADRYTIRFTPRKPGSTWSTINVRHADRLKKLGRMHPAGLKAFAARDPKKSGIYSYEQPPQAFPPALEKVFRANKKASDFWQQQPAGYRRTAMSWVISAKQEATRERRLGVLISDSVTSRRIDQLAPMQRR